MADEPAKDPPQGLAAWLTLPGRILLAGCILGSMAMAFLVLEYTLPALPAGGYPLYVWIVPAGIAGFLIFVGAAFLLERLGVKIYRRGGP